MNPNLIHPDDEDREYELNRELDRQEAAIIAGRILPDAPETTYADVLIGDTLSYPVMDPHGHVTEQPRMVTGITDSHPENRVFYWAEGGFAVADRDAAAMIINRVSRNLADRIESDPDGLYHIEPPAPHDDEHGPMAATLSDRTMSKVLSRPAHVSSIVMLDRDAAAQHLADAVSDYLAASVPKPLVFLRQALADYRETCQ